MSAADRGGRVAPPPADPSEATGRVKRRDNQLHRARVLEVRIQSPPARSLQTFGPSRSSDLEPPFSSSRRKPGAHEARPPLKGVHLE
jgi:hypothetical protein